MKHLKQNIALYLLVLSVISFNSAEFFHNHSNDLTQRDDNNCSACLLHSAINSADLSESTVISIPLITYGNYTSTENTFTAFELSSTIQDRAPPFTVSA